MMIVAYSEPASSSNANLEIVLIGLGVIVVAAVLAFIPVAICWARRHRGTEIVTAIAVVWALVAAASVVLLISAQMKWSREQTMRIESGYFDPRDQSDAPAVPIKTWSALGIVYAGLVGWSLRSGPVPQVRNSALK